MTADEPRALGAHLRAEREDLGLSRSELARRLLSAIPDDDPQRPDVGTMSDYVKRWETGKVRHVSVRYQHAYATVLDKDRHELFGPQTAEQRAVWRAEVLSDLLPDGDLSARLAPVTGSRIGLSTIKDLSARVHGLRLADDVLAGGDLIQPAFRELDNAVRLHREADHREDVGRGLLAAVGEFAQIAGWVASDAGDHDRAADAYRLGVSAAKEAGDGTLESNLIGSLAYQVSNVGDPQEAVTLALAGLEAAGAHAPPRARALAWDRVAWTHAQAGDAQDAMRALGEASEALAEHGGEDEPGYLYWVDPSELQIMEARTYTELRRPLRAVPLLIDVLSRYDVTHARELALYLSWLAVALADANEPEEAAATAERMLTLSADMTSERITKRARVVLARLAPYSDVPPVRELLDHQRRSA